MDNSSSMVCDDSSAAATSSFPALKCQFGFDTDIGGGRENQDECFIVNFPEQDLIVACILDGHGREVGRIAAVAARARLERLVQETLPDIIADPVKWLVDAHSTAHFHIKQSFRAELESLGNEVSETPEGYLMKRRGGAAAWSCVHGGSSCTLCVIIGYKLYIANVGDSTATLCTRTPVLQQSMITHIVDAARPLDRQVLNKPLGSESASSGLGPPMPAPTVDTLMIIAEHSPESPEEFLRLREARHRDGDPSQPSLLVVYDTPSVERSKCNPVFEFDSNGYPVPTNRGRYYKNVRKEWASLVSTPGNARFQDALAFTRSLGDLHLHTYGVTHLPEVQSIDLVPIFQRLATVASDAPLPLVSIVLCSDGVWDNWTYEDVTKFVLDPSCMNAVAAGGDGGRRVTASFMQRNGIYAKRNFGAQADNATGIVIYLSPADSFPSQT